MVLGVNYSTMIISNPQNSIGNYQGPDIQCSCLCCALTGGSHAWIFCAALKRLQCEALEIVHRLLIKVHNGFSEVYNCFRRAESRFCKGSIEVLEGFRGVGLEGCNCFGFMS